MTAVPCKGKERAGRSKGKGKGKERAGRSKQGKARNGPAACPGFHCGGDGRSLPRIPGFHC